MILLVPICFRNGEKMCCEHVHTRSINASKESGVHFSVIFAVGLKVQGVANFAHLIAAKEMKTLGEIRESSEKCT